MGLIRVQLNSYLGPLAALICLPLLAGATVPLQEETATHEIKVTLFGQPCSLRGPVNESTLKIIHTISPEQLYPTFAPGESSVNSTKKALEKLRVASETPGALDTYKERIGKRLHAEEAFLAGLESVKKTHKVEALVNDTRRFIADSKRANFEMTAKKLEAKEITNTRKRELIQELFAIYESAMPSDPEEEFHKAIHALKIQYVCTFEGDDVSN